MLRLLSVVAVLLAVAANPAVAGVAQTIDTPGVFYSPASATVNVGDTVAFSASLFHPLRNDDAIFACDDNCQLTFYSARDWNFFCLNHAGFGMTGVLTVQVDPDRIFANGSETAVFFP